MEGEHLREQHGNSDGDDGRGFVEQGDENDHYDQFMQEYVQQVCDSDSGSEH